MTSSLTKARLASAGVFLCCLAGLGLLAGLAPGHAESEVPVAQVATAD